MSRCGSERAVLPLRLLCARHAHVLCAHDVRRAARTEAMYKKWVQRLSSVEYADELVVLAVAVELRIRICCIPHTPDSAVSPWAPSTYGPLPLPGGAGEILSVGNNDVHYVYLSLLDWWAHKLWIIFIVCSEISLCRFISIFYISIHKQNSKCCVKIRGFVDS